MKLNCNIINKIRNKQVDWSHAKKRGLFYKSYTQDDIIDTVIQIAYNEGLRAGKK